MPPKQGRGARHTDAKAAQPRHRHSAGGAGGAAGSGNTTSSAPSSAKSPASGAEGPLLPRCAPLRAAYSTSRGHSGSLCPTRHVPPRLRLPAPAMPPARSLRVLRTPRLPVDALTSFARVCACATPSAQRCSGRPSPCWRSVSRPARPSPTLSTFARLVRTHQAAPADTGVGLRVG
jgi:hypothetical protein